MQHHGAPTRLLDWTYSPFVAAYFAVEQSPSTDAAVFLAHINTLGRSFAQAFHPTGIKNEQLRDPTIAHHLAACIPPKRSIRLVAQQGLFTLSSHVLGDHGKLIEDSPPPGQNPHRKFIIPKKLKTEMLAHLRTMGIGAHSLFPGIDGLGRSTAEIAIIGATHLALATTSKADEHKPSTTTIPGNPSTDTATEYHDNSSRQGN
jgi:hypothetical protein